MHGQKREAVVPSGSVRDGSDLAAGIYHRGPRLPQQLVEGSLPEELLKLLVAHFFQSLHAVVIQRIGTSAATNENSSTVVKSHECPIKIQFSSSDRLV